MSVAGRWKHPARGNIGSPLEEGYGQSGAYVMSLLEQASKNRQPEDF